MQTTIITQSKAKELNVTYLATLYKDEPTTEEGVFTNGIVDVEARIKGEGIDLVRTYLSNGQFRPTSSTSRLSEEENEAILNGVMDLFEEYGSTDKQSE